MTPDHTAHARSTDRDTGGRPADTSGDTGDHPLEVVVEGVRHGIDQVADKVKGLLRSSR